MLDFLLGNDALSALVAFALVLIPAIFIHELGHFLAAKAVGITILEFGIGFPPRMVTLFKRGATEYTLNWLPIGGFVRPLGEDFVRPVSDEQLAKDREELKSRIASGELTAEAARESVQRQDPLYNERAALKARGVDKIMSVNEARPLGRIFFMAAGSFSNLIVAVILFTIIGLSGLPTFIGGSIGIISVQPDSTLAEAGLQDGDVIETINGEYFQDSADFRDQLYALDGEQVTVSVLRADVDEPLTLIFTPEFNDTVAGVENYIYISSISPDSPAEAAGIQPGDLVVAFNGEPFTAFEDLSSRTESTAGTEVTLTLLREGEMSEVTVVPRLNPPPNSGAIGIGIRPAFTSPEDGFIYTDASNQQALVPLSLGESVQYGFGRIGFFLESLIRLPADLIGGVISPEEARFISPLGISQIGGVFLQRSIEQNRPVIILEYIAVISVALGITNLLPLPMLDGGRIVFVLIEMVRGRPISPRYEGMVHLIGMALLLSLIVLTFLNDILNPVTNLLP